MIHSISVHNFKTIASLELTELSGKIISVVGPPNTGKTNLGEAILWALTNHSSRIEHSADVIKAGEKEATVQLQYENHTLLVTQRGAHRNAVRTTQPLEEHRDTNRDKTSQPRVTDPPHCPIAMLLRATYILLRINGRLDTFINWSRLDANVCLDLLLGLRLYRDADSRLRPLLRRHRKRTGQAEFRVPILEDQLRNLQQVILPTEQEIIRARLGVKNREYNAKLFLDRVLLRKEDLVASITQAKTDLKREQEVQGHDGHILKHLEWLKTAYTKTIPIARLEQVLPSLNTRLMFYLGQLGIYDTYGFLLTPKKSSALMPEFWQPPFIGDTRRFYSGIAISLALGELIVNPPGLMFLDIDRDLPASKLRQDWLRALLKNVAATRGAVIITGHPDLADEVITLPGRGRPTARGKCWRGLRHEHYVSSKDPTLLACYKAVKARKPAIHGRRMCIPCELRTQNEKELD